MRLRIFILTLCLPLLVTACTNTRPVLSLPEQAGAEHGLLYVYRPLALSNALQTPQVRLNGQAESAVSNGEFISLPLAPGQQRLSLQLAKQDLPTVLVLQVQVQQQYFVRVDSMLDFSAEQGWQRAFQLQQVRRETALAEMQPMLQKQQKQVVSETSLEVDEADDNGSHFSIQKTQNPFAR